MKDTQNLNLPLYEDSDEFDLTRMNSGNNIIDSKWKELDDFRQQMPLVNANAEIVEARGDKDTLKLELDDIRNTSVKKADYIRENNNKKILYANPTDNLFSLIGKAQLYGCDVWLSKGTYTITSVLFLYTSVNIYGNGSTIIDGITGTIPDGIHLIEYKVDPNNTKGFIKDLNIIVNHTNMNGIKIDMAQNCLFDNVKISAGTGCDIAFNMTGTVGSDFSKHCSTNTLFNCVAYNCGKGLFLDTATNDTNISNCNFGYCDEPVVVNGGSNHFDNCVIWGSKLSTGMYVNGNQTFIRNCNIEGNKKEGVVFTEFSSHSTLDSCKFMSNGRENADTYNHVYITGSSDNIVKNISINNCKFMGSSSNADGDGKTIRAIGIESTHEGISINNCSFMYNTTGTIYDLTKAQVFGLQAKDMMNGVQITSGDNREYWQLNPSELCHDIESGFMYYGNPVTKNIVTMATPYSYEEGDYRVTIFPNSIRKADGTFKNYAKVDFSMVTSRLPIEMNTKEGSLFRRYAKLSLPTGIKFKGKDKITITTGCTHWQIGHTADYSLDDNSVTFCTTSEIQAYAQLSNANHFIYFTISGEIN